MRVSFTALLILVAGSILPSSAYPVTVRQRDVSQNLAARAAGEPSYVYTSQDSLYQLTFP